MKKNLFKVIFLLVVIITVDNNNVFAQKTIKKPTVKLSAQAPETIRIISDGDTLYQGGDNYMNIVIPEPYNAYDITISQGVIRNENDSAKTINGVNILSELKPGNVTINIYSNLNGNRQIAYQKTFGIKDRKPSNNQRHLTKYSAIQPKIRIDGGNSEITISALRKANKLIVERPFKILGYAVIINNGRSLFNFCSSIYFNSDIKELLMRCNEGSQISIEGVILSDDQGNEYMYDGVLIKVVADKN